MLVFSDDMQVDDVTFCVEDRLRSLGILRNNDELTSNSMLDSKILKGFNLEANWPQRKVCLLHRWNTMSFFATISVAIYNSNCFFPSDFSFLHQMREYVLSMTPSDAYKLLKVLLSMWQSRCASLIFEIVCLPFSSKQQPIWFFFSKLCILYESFVHWFFNRSCCGKYILPWICCVLVNHSEFVISQEPVTQLLDSLYKVSYCEKKLIFYPFPHAIAFFFLIIWESISHRLIR